MRSATAPAMSATVIAANIAWKPTNAIVGSVASGSSVIRPSSPKNSNGLDTNGPPAPKVIE